MTLCALWMTTEIEPASCARMAATRLRPRRGSRWPALKGPPAGVRCRQAVRAVPNIAVSVFDLAGYRPRDELVAVMHAEPGFQAVRVSLRDDVTMVILTVRHDSTADQQALLRERLM